MWRVGSDPEHAMRLHGQQTMPYHMVFKLQSTVVDLLLDTIRELHLDENAIRVRMSAKFAALREAGYPVIDLDTVPLP
jgi:hypothetical protein